MHELRGPLLVVRGVAGVGWDEFAVIRSGGDAGADEVRHGLVLEVDRDLAVVQVLEGTEGLRARRYPGGLHRAAAAHRGRDRLAGPGMQRPRRAGRRRAADRRHRHRPGGRVPAQPDPSRAAGRAGAHRHLGHRRADYAGARTEAADLLLAGLPHLELAAQIAAQATAGAEPFSVVFAAMGLTHADADTVRATLEERSAAGELLLLLNTADDPVIERIFTPRIALTVAEHLAFELGRHVLVVLADMTSYAEALREVSSARGEMPGRRAYPGYLYSDLASLYERCGRIRGRPGSVTVAPGADHAAQATSPTPFPT